MGQRFGLILAAVVVVAWGFVTPRAGADASQAAATTCPSGGAGGPFLRVCSIALTRSPTGPETAVGAGSLITLPCSTGDLKARKYYDSSGHVIGATTDEGYVYFATYAAGGEEIEVGYFHNPNLRFNGYTLYVRHKSFWNQSTSEATPCGTTVGLSSAIEYDKTNRSVAHVIVQNVLHGGRSGEVYDFSAKAGQATMVPYEFTLNGGPTHAGKGVIAKLSEAAWQNACEGCTIGMLTAIAQNVPGGVSPNPLNDGAAFGPVSWNKILIADHDRTGVTWTSAMTGPTIVWKPGVTKATKSGAPPTYTVNTVQVRCVASTTGNDRWTC